MGLETYAIDVIEGKRGGRWFFYLLSMLYRLGVSLHQFIYAKKWIMKTEVDACVVSVGNIVAGGTGKTPVVKKLVKELGHGKKVAILARGYRASVEKSGSFFQVAADTPASECGDEPLMLAQKCPEAVVWVGKNRSLSAREAIKQGAKILVLDDGMQHRRLKRDFELVVMHAADLFGKGHFLPRGYLRESPKRLEAASLIVVTGVENFEKHEAMEHTLSSFTKAPIVSMRMHIATTVAAETVGVFCGIASPRRFFDAVRALGKKVVAEWALSDHTAPTLEALQAFALRCKERGAEAIVCTEKDRVKLPEIMELALPLLVLEAELEIVRGANHWNTFIEKVKHERKL